MGLDMDLYQSKKTDEMVGYWRKANAIHGWFVRNVQNNVDNCGTYVVTKEKLMVLLDLCKSILGDFGSALNIELAKEKLPPVSGFFFGSNEIDDKYVLELKNTISILEPLLNFQDEAVFYYCASG